jgi:hypothetical protein
MRNVPLAILLALLCATATATATATAQAAVIHQPAPGASVQQERPLFFDWAWDEDEYATTGIVFTHSADPTDPVWTWQAGQPATDPGRRVVVTDAGYSFLDSHATVTFRGSSFAAGQWYWRLCNESIYGEDDKCGLDAEIRPLTVTSAPPPPVDQCDDGVDNDGDGKSDYDDLDNIYGDLDSCDHVKPPTPVAKPLHKLTFAETKHLIRKALKRRFRGAYRAGYAKRISACERRSKTKVTCRRVFWVVGDASYAGRATIWPTRKDGAPYWNSAYTIKRTNEYCLATGGHHCTKTYRVR